jgi:hypothetical protein
VTLDGGGTRVIVRGGGTTSITVDRRTVATIAGRGVQGAPGPRGESGSGTAVDVTRSAGAVIHGLRVVRATSGIIYPVDLAEALHAEQVIGVATQSVTTIGHDVVVRTSGPLSDNAWNWQPGAVFCGADGVLTQDPATTGWLLQVARVIDAQTIDIDIETPIYRG